MNQGNDDAICGELRDRGAHELAALSNQDIALRAQLGAHVLEILEGCQPDDYDDDPNSAFAHAFLAIDERARSLGLLREETPK